MLIGSKFSKKYQRFLREIGSLSQEDTCKQISVKKINDNLEWDRTEIKNGLEYFQEIGLINTKTIGGPLLYGHVTLTELGIEKYESLFDHE